MPETKFCNKCKTEKLVTDFPFYRSGPRSGQPFTPCKACKKIYMREWLAKNPDKAEEQKNKLKEWIKQNPERSKKAIANWWRKNPEKRKAKNQKRREKGYFKKYRAANIERRHSYWKAYYQKNKSAILAKNAAYESANKERITAYRKKWRTPERSAVANHRRRARFAESFGAHTAAELTNLLEQQQHLCANPHCQSIITKQNKSLDHIVPLAKGGSNDIANLQWLCRACNTSKGTTSMDEWLERYASKCA